VRSKLVSKLRPQLSQNKDHQESFSKQDLLGCAFVDQVIKLEYVSFRSSKNISALHVKSIGTSNHNRRND